MANVFNVKGTSFPSFRIGKGGGNISQGAAPTDIDINSTTRIDQNITGAGAVSFQNAGGQVSTQLLTDSATAGQTHELRFYELASTTDYIAFKAPDAIAAAFTLTLPNADGSRGQYMATDGAGTLDWGSAADYLYEVYDSSTQTITATATAIGYDTERASNANFALAAGVVTIGANAAGTYTIEYHTSTDSTNGTRDTVLSEIYINGAVYVGSGSYIYNRNVANGEGSSSKKVTATLAAGDTVEVRVDLLNGAGCETIANQSNLLLERKGP